MKRDHDGHPAPPDTGGLMDVLTRKSRHRRSSPRRRLVGLVLFSLLAVLAWLMAPRPDVRVLNASPATLTNVKVCIAGQCETRDALGATATWNVPLTATGGASVTLTFDGASAPGTTAQLDSGQRLRFRVTAPDAVETQVR